MLRTLYGWVKKSALIVKSPIWFSIKYQLFSLAVVSTVLLISSTPAAYSFAVGGLVYVVPNLYFMHYALRYSGSDHVPLIAQSFSMGESGKLALAAVGFVLVFRFVNPLHVFALFAGFISMIILQWFIAAKIATAMGSNSDN